jgi:N-hydroxyarylamine O-acetyltransferase
MEVNMDRQKLFDDLYGPLYAPIPDSAKYLERIGMQPIKKADKETLDALVAAHQRNVPFENLDIYDLDVNHLSLYIENLYDKIVLQRRGGYCFETNAAFMALLTSLGYDCYAVGVRIVINLEKLSMPISHRATVVTVDGVRYFCDVGFGGPSPQGAVMLDYTGEQLSGSNVFIVEKAGNGYEIYRIVDGVKEREMIFDDIPVDPVDFLAPNEYQSRSKNSFFKFARICNLVTETGSITLGGNILKIHSNGGTVEKTLETEGELRGALKEHYGIDVGFQLNM